MAVCLMEGFDHYLNTETILKGWTDTFSFVVAGRYGFGQGFQTTGSGGSTRFKNLEGGAKLTTWTGFALHTNDISVAATNLFIWRSSTTNTLRLQNNTSGQLILANSGGTALITSTRTTASNQWHFYEVYMFINGASSDLEFHIDGTFEASAVVNLGAVGIDNVGIGNVNGQRTAIDDLWVLDDDATNGAPTGFQGEVLVDTTVRPASEGNTIQWTPSTGTDNALTIDDPTDINPADYNESGTVGNKDTFVCADLTVTSGDVLAVQTNMYAFKGGPAPSRGVTDVIRHSGTDYLGSEGTLGASGSVFTKIYQRNPAAIPWTIADINAAEFGYELTS